jgi:hypothetical protein
MKRFNIWAVLAIVGLISICVAVSAIGATSNPSPASPGYTPVVLPIMKTYTGATTKAAVIKYTAPNGYKVVAANATARTASGTNPTLKIRGKSATYVNYSGTVTAAGTTKDLTVTTNKITDESAVTIDLVVGGTATPTWTDITLMLLLKRL